VIPSLDESVNYIQNQLSTPLTANFVSSQGNKHIRKEIRIFKCNTSEEKGNAYRILVGKPEGKRPLGRPRIWFLLKKSSAP
jgi:hypothetical protein